MGFFSKKTSCLGLDIGENSIKIMEVKKAGSGYEIKQFGIVPTPQSMIEGSLVVNEKGLASVIAELGKKVKAEAPMVAVAVTGDSIIVRHLKVPVMPDRELAEAVRFEAEAQLPIPGQDVTIDFIKHKVVTEGGIKKQEIVTVAVRNDIIKKITRLVESAGFIPVIMDIEPLTLLRAISLLNPSAIPQEGSFAIVNIGSISTNISVFINEQLEFTRKMSFGGYKLTMSLANHYNQSFEEAEATKKLIDLRVNSDQENPPVLMYQKQEILLLVISELITEVDRSLEYYLAQHRGQKVTRIFLTGGGAQLKGIASLMSDELDIPVEVFNPIKYMQISKKLTSVEKDILDAGAALTEVVGLALSEVQ
jgi:type IV pilus assembly protein PilM